MRGYFFGNMYLKLIQQGIQAFHTGMEMVNEYVFSETASPHSPQHIALQEWATHHKTVILLDAGFSSEIGELCAFFRDTQNEFPWGTFFEERDAINGAQTCVGIILPERIYTLSSELRSRRFRESEALENDIRENGFWDYKPEIGPMVQWNYVPWELKLAKRINQYPLAR